MLRTRGEKKTGGPCWTNMSTTRDPLSLSEVPGGQNFVCNRFFWTGSNEPKFKKYMPKTRYQQKKLQSVPMTVLVVKIHFPNFTWSGNVSQLFQEKTCGMHQWSHMDVSQTSKWRTSKIWKLPAIHDLSVCDWLSLFFWNKPPFAEGERWHVFIDWE